MVMKSSLVIKKAYKETHFAFKCDYLLPSGSFKYREAYTIQNLEHLLNIETVILASSGNTHRAVKMLLSNTEVISYLWGAALSRIEATKCAIDTFRKYDPSKTLLLTGPLHPIKVIAHESMARELLGQLREQNFRATHYFQATGSGYGCRAIQNIIGEPIVPVMVRPELSLDYLQWAPALADAPDLEDVLHISSEEIQSAWEWLNDSFSGGLGEPLPGLEAAVAFAGAQKYLREHPDQKIRPVVNLTGQLRGRLPW